MLILLLYVFCFHFSFYHSITCMLSLFCYWSKKKSRKCLEMFEIKNKGFTFIEKVTTFSLVLVDILVVYEISFLFY